MEQETMWLTSLTVSMKQSEQLDMAFENFKWKIESLKLSNPVPVIYILQQVYTI